MITITQDQFQSFSISPEGLELASKLKEIYKVDENPEQNMPPFLVRLGFEIALAILNK